MPPPPSYLHSQHLPDCRIQHFSNLNFIGVCFAHMCASACGSQRWASVPASEVVHFLYLEAWSLTIFRLGYVASEPQGSFCLSVPSAWMTIMFHHSEIFMWFLGVRLKSSCFTNWHLPICPCVPGSWLGLKDLGGELHEWRNVDCISVVELVLVHKSKRHPWSNLFCSRSELSLGCL